MGFVVACLVVVAVVVAAFFFGGPQISTISHDVELLDRKTIKVIACHFAWGIEHGERQVSSDTFVLEYVSTVPHTDLVAVDRETVQTFELIRPISELWGLNIANVSVFPTAQRKGAYLIYTFSRNLDGNWNFERKPAKVFVND